MAMLMERDKPRGMTPVVLTGGADLPVSRLLMIAETFMANKKYHVIGPVKRAGVWKLEIINLF